MLLFNIIITLCQQVIFYRYKDPKFLHALKSAPCKSITPNESHTFGLKILLSGTLCKLTGIL